MDAKPKGQNRGRLNHGSRRVPQHYRLSDCGPTEVGRIHIHPLLGLIGARGAVMTRCSAKTDNCFSHNVQHESVDPYSWLPGPL